MREFKKSNKKTRFRTSKNENNGKITLFMIEILQSKKDFFAQIYCSHKKRDFKKE